jgi:hypothetical protein
VQRQRRSRAWRPRRHGRTLRATSTALLRAGRAGDQTAGASEGEFLRCCFLSPLRTTNTTALILLVKISPNSCDCGWRKGGSYFLSIFFQIP